MKPVEVLQEWADVRPRQPYPAKWQLKQGRDLSRAIRQALRHPSGCPDSDEGDAAYLRRFVADGTSDPYGPLVECLESITPLVVSRCIEDDADDPDLAARWAHVEAQWESGLFGMFHAAFIVLLEEFVAPAHYVPGEFTTVEE